MSRSHKDGRHRGAHIDTQNREVWSKRYRKVVCWDRNADGVKRLTHRYERRQARHKIVEQLEEET